MTVKDLRVLYFKTTGKKASVNWSKPVLEKKIKLAQAEKAIDQEADKKTSEQVTQDINPEFEAMLDSPDNDNIPSLENGDSLLPNTETQETRGGYRENAGRPYGQTDKRAYCEHLMKLEVPDLAILEVLRGLNLGLAVKNVLPFRDEQLKKIALGITRPLYYWFPALDGRTDVFTLHLMSLQDIGSAIKEHTADVRQFQLELEKEQQNNGETTEENPAGQTTTTTKNTGRKKVTRKKTGSKRSTK